MGSPFTRGIRVPHRFTTSRLSTVHVALTGIATASLVLAATAGLPGTAVARTASATRPARSVDAASPVVRVTPSAPGLRTAHLLAGDGRRVSAVGLDAVGVARRQIDRVGAAFGVRAADLATVSHVRVGGSDIVRFQQRRGGIPVVGGQLVVALDGSGGLRSVTGETAGRPSTTTYAVARSTAARTAARAIARVTHLSSSALRAGRPTRWLLDATLLGRAAPGTNPGVRPVWQVVVTAPGRPDLRRLVLVDATTGRVAMSIEQAPSLDRVVCNDIRTEAYQCRPGLYKRIEGSGPTGVPDIDQAYDLTGATATWWATTLGVDLTALIGNDLGDGRKLRSTTNYCPSGSCPLDNAFWSGDQMVYGAGFTSADDVVAHELAHGVTQHTSGLIYWYQSGALNESMSDVFGELVDQGDGVGNDAPDVRWKLGEDLPAAAGGIARDMANPPAFGQPDTTGSPLYDPATGYDDSGAVHTNSGVPNKAAYLIVDGTVGEAGGAFRGQTFAGIGAARAAALYWTTEQMLTPGSDFADLAATLNQACVNLAFTPAECATVAAATTVTELARGAAPSAPRSVVVKGGPGEVSLRWAPSANEGSRPLNSYVVQTTPAIGGEDSTTLEPTATSATVPGMLPGVDYTVRLLAVNPDGASPAVTTVLSGSSLAVTAPLLATYGARVRITGTLHNAGGVGLRGRRVSLLRRDVGAKTFRVAGTTVTTPTGTFAFSWPARRASTWFVGYPGAAREIGHVGKRHTTSVAQQVTARAASLTVRAGRLVTLTGRVAPRRTGVVVLQRQTPSGGWVTVSRATLGARGYRLSWRVPKAQPTALRVRVDSRPSLGLVAGLSRVLILNPAASGPAVR